MLLETTYAQAETSLIGLDCVIEFEPAKESEGRELVEVSLFRSGVWFLWEFVYKH